MRTSASSRPVDRKKHPKGYTLLEIIMVLALLGLLGAIAIPRVSAMYASTRWASERDDALRRIAGLAFEAYRTASPFELTAYPLPEGVSIPLELPEGWSLRAEAPIHYTADGVCTGGRLQLGDGDRWVLVDIVSPFGIPLIR